MHYAPYRTLVCEYVYCMYPMYMGEGDHPSEPSPLSTPRKKGDYPPVFPRVGDTKGVAPGAHICIITAVMRLRGSWIELNESTQAGNRQLNYSSISEIELGLCGNFPTT